MSSTDSTPNRRLTWNLYLAEVLPELLDEAGVTPERISLVVAEVAARAQDYAAGGRTARRALRVPFLDDVVDFEPAQAPIGTRADVAVVVRNSALEEDHAHGRLDDEPLLRSHAWCAARSTSGWPRTPTPTKTPRPSVSSPPSPTILASVGTERLSGVHAKQLRAALNQLYGRTDTAH